MSKLSCRHQNENQFCILSPYKHEDAPGLPTNAVFGSQAIIVFAATTTNFVPDIYGDSTNTLKYFTQMTNAHGINLLTGAELSLFNETYDQLHWQYKLARPTGPSL